MKRRTFIKGAVAAAVAAALPAGDGVATYTHKTYALATPGMDGSRMAAALARSMMQTREVVAANVFNRAFGDTLEMTLNYDSVEQCGINKFHYGVSGEGARRSVGGGGSPDRI